MEALDGYLSEDSPLVTKEVKAKMVPLFSAIKNVLKGLGYHHPISCSEKGCDKCTILMASAIPERIVEWLRFMAWIEVEGQGLNEEK